MMSVQKGVDILKKEKRRNNYNKNSSRSWSNQKSKVKEKKKERKEGKEINPPMISINDECTKRLTSKKGKKKE